MLTPKHIDKVFRIALFVIVKKQTTKMSFSERMVKQTVIRHTMKYYSAIERNKLLIHSTICMNLKEIMHSEKNQP